MKKKFNFGCYKSPIDPRDYLVTTLVEDIIKELPPKFDLTDKMTPVRSQGNEGACVGFAGAVGVKEYQEQIDYGRFVAMSPRFLYEESKKISGHSEGTTLKACAQVLITLGVAEEKFWKYIPKNPQQPLPGAYHNALKYKVEPAYVRITNEAELKASLVKFGAILVGVLVTNNWRSVGKDGIVPKMNWFQKFLLLFGIGILGGHAICIVGYSDETKLYKFKNSWGEEWGLSGYGFIHYDDMKITLMDAIQMVDIDDIEDWKKTTIKRVCNLTWLERKTTWV